MENDFSVGKSETDPQLLFQVAKLIGMDPINEPQFLWIAEAAINTSLPNEWKEFEDEHGDIAYIHTKTQKIQRIHPVIDKFAVLYKKQKEYSISLSKPESLDSKQMEVQIENIFDLMRRRINDKLPACTPEIFERLCVFFNIDSSEDMHIARILKAVSNGKAAINAMPFLHAIQDHLARATLLFGREPLVFCTECEIKTANYKCVQCKDHFCQNCFSTLHAVGARKKHETIDVIQSVCSECSRSHADVFCRECAALFCEVCFSNTHDKRNKLNHSKKRVTNMICTECEEHDVEVICEDCLDVFCKEDFARMHRKGNRAKHLGIVVDNKNDKYYKNNKEISPLEVSELLDRMQELTRSNSYITFLDDNNVPYWYCMQTKKITRTLKG